MPEIDTTIEIWKPIPEFEGWYEVSNFGRIKRVKAGKATKIGNIRRVGVSGDGYPLVRLSRNGKESSFKVHRLVIAVFVGPCPDGQEVNHKDGNKENPALDNLEYVSRSENLIHRYRVLGQNGLRGLKNPKSKLAENEVRLIMKSTEAQRFLAARFNVTTNTIWLIRTRRTWKHIS